MITEKRLKKLLEYSQTDGLFRWSHPRNRGLAGKVAGCLSEKGYIVIKVDNKSYKAHRLAWLYMYGEWPKGEIDHLNHVTTDNRIENLRDVEKVANGRNQKLHKKWHAQMGRLGEKLHFGSYDDIWDAICARKSAEAKYGFHDNHGKLFESTGSLGNLGGAS